MPNLHLLGTGAALSDPHRTTTMLAFEDDDPDGPVVLVDCGGDLIQRVMAAGIALARIDGLILTHEHPDHVGGFPLVMEKLWLSGRTSPMPIYGPQAALDQAEHLFHSFDTHDWAGMPEIRPHPLPMDEGVPVLENATWRITASPGIHGRVGVVGVRVESRRTGGVVAYSSDTRPAPSIVRLARGADILVHEATEESQVHSTAEEAATVAREAGARRLLLVHLPTEFKQPEATMDRARAVFPALEKGEELGRYPF